MVGSYTIKHILTTWSTNHSPWYLLKGVENVYLHKYLYISIYRSFIHNCQNLEATKIYFGRWKDKLYIQTLKYYSPLKRNELSISGGNLYKVKEVNHTVYETLHTVWFELWNRQNYGDSTKSSNYQAFRVKKMNWQSIEDF